MRTESTGFVIHHQTSQYCNYWALAGIITACVNLGQHTGTHVAQKESVGLVGHFPNTFSFDPVCLRPTVHNVAEETPAEIVVGKW